jgi:ectoine hydroxylase-related dioxygenase (phytanoyl-CoA dioxygenase family)
VSFVRLEPSVYAWALGRGQRSGESFNLPHRDYPHSEAFDAAMRPCIVNVWVPLNDATVDNGCMYALPKVRVGGCVGSPSPPPLLSTLTVCRVSGSDFSSTLRF